MELVGNRRAECVKMDARDAGTHLEFTIPARGLIGLRTRLMNATSGEAIMHHNFYDYQPCGRHPGPAQRRDDLDGDRPGDGLRPRQPAGARRAVRRRREQVYEGQIVGEHCRDNDLPVNVCREKKLTNMRSAGARQDASSSRRGR